MAPGEDGSCRYHVPVPVALAVPADAPSPLRVVQPTSAPGTLRGGPPRVHVEHTRPGLVLYEPLEPALRPDGKPSSLVPAPLPAELFLRLRQILQHDGTVPHLRDKTVRRHVEEGVHPPPFPTLQPSEVEPLEAVVGGNGPLDPLAFAGHRPLDPRDGFEVNGAHHPLRGGVVGGRHVHVHPHHPRSLPAFLGGVEVKHECPICDGETEFPVRYLPIVPEERILDRGQVESDVMGRREGEVEGVPVETIERGVKRRLEAGPTGWLGPAPVPSLGVEAFHAAEDPVPRGKSGGGLVGDGDGPRRFWRTER